MYENILNYFSLLKKLNCFSTSYLFVGEDLLQFSLEIAKLINCPNSNRYCDICESCRELKKKVSFDLFIIEEPSYIKIDNIRQAQRFLSFKSSNLSKKILIVNRAHNFTEEAANSFLKTLEEPPKNSFIILLSSRLDTILPTIISRCKSVYFPSESTHSRFNNGGTLETFLNTKNIGAFKNRELARSFFSDLIVFLRDYIIFVLTNDRKILLNQSSYEIICRFPEAVKIMPEKLENIIKIYNDLDNINVNLAVNLLNLSAFSE
ncbi:MAG: hypothetical protein KAS99_00890 [Candidatus Omnitrophica bacterium]|nr:hypothetical protein [Candidatus Omnitrophota bacterium]